MADMRLIVAGAGGRMGRTLMRVISETPGAVLAGALEAPGSELLGKDAGVLAGLPENGIKLSADLWTLSANADGIIDFTVPAATIANVAIAAERGLVHVIGTTGFSAADEPRSRASPQRAVIVKSGNMSLGVNLLAALVKRVAQTLDENSTSKSSKCITRPRSTRRRAPRCCWATPRPKAAASICDTHSARGRDGHTGARKPGDIGFAALARRHRGRRAQRDFCRRPPSASSWRTTPRTA